MWLIAPLTPGACRADREWHHREVAALSHELRNIWTNACLTTHLAQVMPPPGAILQVPTIGRIALDEGAPARFSVKLRSGQLPIDFRRRSERLAAAFRVPAVEIVSLTDDHQWISVRLLEPSLWIDYPDEFAVEGWDRPVMDEVDEPEELEPVPVVDVEPAPTTAFGTFRRFLGDFWRADPDRDRDRVERTG
ncbi:hypothetical protein [Actinomycetospora sp. NBRC 106378]|uniref:hypothetical protein n=1 Tax=Actinomycetospora sp. NBRC 106378 TaxID=3032208 RepID=UPI0024A2954B|nr:hypothetical protein [Actinomycetospora sp. NBRC 106378]GLZ55445.1 hypothetical protein Acsp07_50620 [Actinomycetospora sp. NBRC 106378]